ncbi:hypothetical protein [Aureivirga marina]|uniref:hypothetical protein n=1 Tax=Aureivirga marina TaxID=1182451 RepID=UPI0018CA3DE8|nr:hypothetical protein [Aureivirga marina]
MKIQFQLDKLHKVVKVTYKKEQPFLYYMLTAYIFFTEEEITILNKYADELSGLPIIDFKEQFYTKPTIFKDAEIEEEEIQIILFDLLSRNDFTIPCNSLEEALNKKEKIKNQIKKISDKLKSLISLDKKEIIKF